jgi:hypothetical protein
MAYMSAEAFDKGKRIPRITNHTTLPLIHLRKVRRRVRILVTENCIFVCGVISSGIRSQRRATAGEDGKGYDGPSIVSGESKFVE